MERPLRRVRSCYYYSRSWHRSWSVPGPVPDQSHSVSVLYNGCGPRIKLTTTITATKWPQQITESCVRVESTNCAWHTSKSWNLVNAHSGGQAYHARHGRPGLPLQPLAKMHPCSPPRRASPILLVGFLPTTFVLIGLCPYCRH